jgi:hypothetical protein
MFTEFEFTYSPTLNCLLLTGFEPWFLICLCAKGHAVLYFRAVLSLTILNQDTPASSPPYQLEKVKAETGLNTVETHCFAVAYVFPR